jgi:CheY-like chemotaxis protein/HPt (histidine-containing phosphotransfer) domain-containing protein
VIKSRTDSQISPAVLVDPLRLRQILNNFVSNALKFTFHGAIEITAELIERAGGEERVRFSVKDTGIGIAAEHQQLLFQPFTQAADDTTRRFGGTGLGLAICQRLADLMAGSIEMVSELGKGTTMILTVSLAIADPGDLAKSGADRRQDSAIAKRRQAPSVARAEKQGTLVLVADDHPINRMLLTRQVNTLGYAVESAETGVDALNRWKSGRFGMIIADCNMPEMDGYELARSIRKLESGTGRPRIPIIACTANALGGEAEKCIAAGMDDYLAKPVELARLLTKLEQWLPIPKAGTTSSDKSGIRPDTAAATATSGPAAPFDRSVLAAIYGDDAAGERAMLTKFRRAVDEDAAKLEQAVASNDMSQVAHASHRAKGSCLIVGAGALAGVCARIEQASRANDRATVEASMDAFRLELLRVKTYLDAL